LRIKKHKIIPKISIIIPINTIRLPLKPDILKIAAITKPDSVKINNKNPLIRSLNFFIIDDKFFLILI